jgi:hypothetical protein
MMPAPQEKADAAMKGIKAAICIHSVDEPQSKRFREKVMSLQSAYYADVRDGKNLSDALFTASPGSAPLPAVHKLTTQDYREEPELGIRFNYVGDLFDFDVDTEIHGLHRRLLGNYFAEVPYASAVNCGAFPDAKYLMMLGVYMESGDRKAFTPRWSKIRNELKEYFPARGVDNATKQGSPTRDIQWFFDCYNGRFDFWRNPVPSRDDRPRYVCVDTECEPVQLRGPPGLLRLAPPAPESQSDTGDIHGDIDISMRTPMCVGVLRTGNSNVLRSRVQRDLCPMKIPMDDAQTSFYRSAETETATTSISSSSRSPSSS